MPMETAFYGEWLGRGPGDRRSVPRAGLLAAALGVTVPAAPVLTVVGSKGKGTTAAYASAWLAAAGCRVVTVTSPALRSDTERIRVGGAAISTGELAGLGRRLAEASRSLPPVREGYLSPSGLFTLAGLVHARDVAAGVIVLEAGMGGVSDEVSLFPPAVLAITEVFGEHLGVLGDTPAEIAADKAGIAAPGAVVVSLPQTPVVAAAIRALAPHTDFLDVPDLANAALGRTAARRLAEIMGLPDPPPERLNAVLGSVRLPGRRSWHAIPGASLLVDSAVSGKGVRAALAEAYRRWDRIDHVLLCLPDHKDLPGVTAELGGLDVTFVRMSDRESLRFTRSPGAVEAAGLTRESLAAYGGRILVLGTGYFTGRILDLVDAPAGRLFEA